MQHGPGHSPAPEGATARRALAALQACLDAVVYVDDCGRVLEFNPAAERLLGLTDQAAGEHVADTLAAPALRADLERALRHAASPLRTFHTAAGVDAEVTITAHRPEAGCGATLFVRDLTATKRAEALRDVEHGVARALAAARSGMEVAPALLRLTAQRLGFDHAELWATDVDHAAQRLVAAWRRTPDTAFADAARRLVVHPGHGLAGMAWEIGETVCVDDARRLEGLPRSAAIAHEGICGCAALPVRVGRDVVAVAVLARVGGEPLDADLRQTLHAIATQLGLFAERRAAERRLERETVALAAVARATRRVTDAVTAADARVAIVEAAFEVCGADHAFLALPDPARDGLVIRHASPPLAPGISPLFACDSPGPIAQAFRQGEPVFFGDIERHPGIDDRAGDAGVRSGLVHPIRRNRETLGVLGVGWSTRQREIDPEVVELIGLLADEAAMAISRVDLVTRLEAAARTDPLTGLANVRAWDDQLTRELAAAHRDGRPVAVAVLDLDGFKALNDARGHQHGDRVLRTSAAAWLAQLRQGDMLARLGGDEFAALLPGCQAGEAVLLAERLREATEDITVSIGIACWDGKETPTQLRGRADAALYAAKAAGRDRIWSG